jgi:UDP-4-amino-4,6-dideoxy-N-acetyl-beta-L-altrosamine N-acetyltransferase
MGTRALEFAFKNLHLHKICGQALDSNLASIHFHQSLGFTEEKVLQKQYLINGNHHDLICFGLLRCKWTATTNSTN